MVWLLDRLIVLDALRFLWLWWGRSSGFGTEGSKGVGIGGPLKLSAIHH